MNFKLKIIDFYIIRKFLGTFFFSLILILSIAIIFDFAEKIDDFIQHEAPLKLIIFDYYLNFIPYFAVLFSSLFVFIAVILFTSKMAYDTEIIAILGSGVSFRRLLYPYFISACVITLLTLYLNNFVIPHATARRLDFEERFYRDLPLSFNESNVHRQIEPGLFIYMSGYNVGSNIGRQFSMERIVDGKLQSKLMADYIKWDTTKMKWIIHNYYIRDINGDDEVLRDGQRIDTTLSITPLDFKKRSNIIETMNLYELNAYIAQQKLQGAEGVEWALIEWHKRIAFPFSTFILALIGVSLSSRKVRGGTGVHIGLGLLISFSYILFMQFATQFAIGGAIPVVVAVWIPNMLFAFVAAYLYHIAPK